MCKEAPGERKGHVLCTTGRRSTEANAVNQRFVRPSLPRILPMAGVLEVRGEPQRRSGHQRTTAIDSALDDVPLCFIAPA
jgi:hypothetical protein